MASGNYQSRACRPRFTTWMPRLCRKNNMVAAAMQYEGARSGRDVGVGQRDVIHGPGVGDLVLQRAVVALEHGDEQGEGQERVGAHAEQRHVVVLAQGAALLLG